MNNDIFLFLLAALVVLPGWLIVTLEQRPFRKSDMDAASSLRRGTGREAIKKKP